MSSAKARKLAFQIDQDNVHYLDANLLEAKQYGVEFVQTSSEFITKLNQTRDEIYRLYTKYRRAWVIAFSGGKDSTAVLQLFYEMIVKMPKSELNPTFAVLSDTLVEAPNVATYLRQIVKAINHDAKVREIPFEILIAKPEPKDEFWVNLIGKGYPSPTRTFRWCTERLKIAPTKKIMTKITAKHGSAILALGVRKSESQSRKRSIEKRILSEDGLNKHDDYANTLIFSPIKEWNIDDVWAYLTMQNPPPWGISHEYLFSLYTQASGDECQFIIDKNQSSCGGSRFGCWVCTLVDEDKSMQGFIKSGNDGLKPLNEFRNFIKAARADKSLRSDFRRNGSGDLGPFTKNARIQILRKLLKTEWQYKKGGGDELISENQLKKIALQWQKDFDGYQICTIIAKEYERMKNDKIKQSIIPNEDIIDSLEIENKDTAKELIISTNELINRGSKDSDVKENIKKYIDALTEKIPNGASDDNI